jgi:hypothetical protein
MVIVQKALTALAIFSVCITSSIVHASQGALYARIEGVYKGRVIQVFKGSGQTKPVSYKTWIKNILWNNPEIVFFNAAHEIVEKKFLELPQNKNHHREYINSLVKTTQARLTQLPAVAAVDVIAFKAPGHQYIKMYDTSGNCIVTTPMHYWGGLGTGDALSAAVINECSKYVSNPEYLKTARIRMAYNQNIITGKLHSLPAW